MLTEKEIKKNQLLTDIKLWIDDYEATKLKSENGDEDETTFEGSAMVIMVKVFDYLKREN